MILIRIFLIIPLMILFIAVSFTVIVPLLYWVITGEDWIDIKDSILNIDLTN